MTRDEEIDQLAQHWSDGVDVEMDGIDLADVMSYDVRRVAGRLALTEGTDDGQA